MLIGQGYGCRTDVRPNSAAAGGDNGARIQSLSKLGRAMGRDFGGIERWRTQFMAMGKAQGGGSGWVLLTYSPRDKRLVNQWA